MVSFTHRELTENERRVSAYEGFVDSVMGGYDMCIYEYTNDLACRQFLEESRDEEEVLGMWNRIEAADRRLRKILLPTKRCIHGEYDETWFWYWGYPPNSPELESDLIANGLI